MLKRSIPDWVIDKLETIKKDIPSARIARLFGFDPKVAFLSHSTFGTPKTKATKTLSTSIILLKNATATTQ